ncbi:MAG: site-specific integrase [Streptosporangiaceae bacterium]
MAASTQRRGHGDDSIYFDASKNRWIGATSLGHSADGQRRIRHKVRGRTKAEVRDKLKALRQELDAGLRPLASYTVRACVEDWLATGLTALQAGTVENYTRMAEHAVARLGAVRLKSLTAHHVRFALEELSPALSTRSLRLVHQVLERSITHAQAADLVARNVAALVAVPKGRPGRSSKSLTLEQAITVLDAAKSTPLSAYVSLSLLSGLRTEELRSLLWADVDLDAGTLAVYRSVRATGDTKTPRSRRVLKLPAKAVAALRDHRLRQSEARLKAGPLWQDSNLVFTSSVGTPLDAHNVRRSFRSTTKAAGVGEDWTPRELRHTFVSLLSNNEVSLEDIARLVGHSGTAVTERVYRHELRPALTQGAEVLDRLFERA